MPKIDDVKKYLSLHAIEVLEFENETPTSEAAANAVGCSTAEIAKSILMLIGDVPVLVVTSGDMKVNSSLLKKAVGRSGKVKLPSADDVAKYTGYLPGGVSPFLLPDELPVCLDSSLKRFSVIYPAAGNSFSAVPLSFSKLKQLSAGIEADVCLPISET